MATFERHPVGAPCWIDLATPDVGAAKEFYGALFGWDYDDTLDPDGNLVYANIELDGQVVAGMGAQQPEMAGMPPVWTTYLATDNAAAVADKVSSAGGQVLMPPMQVFDAGTMAIFEDATGAVFAAWQPDRHQGAAVANEPNTWCWNELMTRDVDAALEFYRDAFGWEYDSTDMGDGMYHVVRGGDYDGLAGLMAMPEGLPDMVPNHWMVYFNVADVDATCKVVSANGGMVGQPPFEVPGVGRLAVIHDPQGGSFSLMQPE